jgi:hypothetical protein
MRIKPIFFNTPMVQAILEGKKTQTRRVMKPQPTMNETGMWTWKDCQWMDGGLGFPTSAISDHAPYRVGDTLWVREAFKTYDFQLIDGIWNCAVKYREGGEND